jgi:betaine-aldehyde dehydrogenase
MKPRALTTARPEPEEDRRQQIIDHTIDTLAEEGFVGTTLARIGARAGISPGLIAHYFLDKERLLEAVFRTLASRVRENVLRRLATAHTPRARVQAVIDANLAPEEFEPRTGIVWLAFWGQVVHAKRLARVQAVYQWRMLSNLQHALRPLMPPGEARHLAMMIAAMIDGVWLRATLSGWAEADGEAARRLVSDFVDSQLERHAPPAGRGRAADQSPPSLTGGGRGEGSARRERNLIGGVLLPNTSRQTFLSRNPASGEILAEIEIAGPPEIEQAVAAATRAQKTWAALTGTERGRILKRAAELLRARNDDLARLETDDTGKPIRETAAVDIYSAADCLEYFAGIAASLAGEHIDLGPAAFGYTRREPLGLVAGIGAWNYPLQIAAWKAAPALACGNAMIFKPAELTPLTALKLGEIFLEAGLPPGLFNVVQGFAETGRLLTRHPLIRKVSLTGEAGTGRAVMADAASTLKLLTLELGGKSPLIVFDDAKLENAVTGAMLANFYSAGEVCSNGTRVFVHRRLYEPFLELLKTRTESLVIGDPADPRTEIGALISEDHLHKVLSYIEFGQTEGAQLLTGGHRINTGPLAHGCFVAPTVFTGCTDSMRIVREEIFGPVMSVLVFDDEDEVIARANATEFGLAAGVFTTDLARAHRVIARLEAGTCWINHYNVTPIELPFGGVKLSGLGRENGRAAIEYYTTLKSVYVALTDIESPYDTAEHEA